MLKWDVYEISAHTSKLNGVKFRGRIRKFAVKNGINLLAENTQDHEEMVRIAVLEGTEMNLIEKQIIQMAPDAKIELKLKGIHNPVLSKLNINDEAQYEL